MKITSKDIILDTDERIRMQSEPVQLPLSNEDRELLQAMLDYVRNSQMMKLPKPKIYSRPLVLQLYKLVF